MTANAFRQSAQAAAQDTSWGLVYAAAAAGVSVALQIGKAAATLPLIRAEFSSNLTVLSVYVALISIVGALGGVFFGTISQRLGPLRTGVIGLLLVAAGSSAGAVAPSLYVLLATRLFEAFGFALVVTSMPALVQFATAPRDKSVGLAIWATWMPTGILVMMAIGYFGLADLGWRGVFWICAALPAVIALVLIFFSVKGKAPVVASGGFRIRQALSPQALLMAAIFIAFSAGNLIIMAFLPTIMVDGFAMSAPNAALVGFFTAAALLPTNILSGWLLKYGFSGRMLFLVSFGGMIVMAPILLDPEFGVVICIAAAGIFSLCSGVPPAIIWASIPVLAKRPSDASVLSGFFFQGAGIGQVLGPVLAGWAVDAGSGWSNAAWAVCGLLSAGFFLSLGIRGGGRNAVPR